MGESSSMLVENGISFINHYCLTLNQKLQVNRYVEQMLHITNEKPRKYVVFV
jgi:hypothetical protein